MTKQYNLLKTMNDGIHYNGALLASHTDCGIFMSTGGRGVGKTTWWIVKAFETFLNTGLKLFYFRRYDTELTKTDKLMKMPAKLCPEFEFRQKGMDLQVKRSSKSKWETWAYVTALSKMKSGRGGDWCDEISMMLFDEFQIDNSNHMVNAYLPNEYSLLVDLYQSICRTRPIPLVMLSNAYTDLNPYYTTWKVVYKDNEITTTTIKAADYSLKIAVERVPESVSLAVNEGSQSFILSMQDEIGQTQFFNKNILDKENWIKERDKKSTWLLSFYDKNDIYSIYINDDYEGFCEKNGNPQGRRCYVSTPYNRPDNTKYVKNYKGEYALELLKVIHDNNNLFYTNQECKYSCSEFMRRIKII